MIVVTAAGSRGCSGDGWGALGSSGRGRSSEIDKDRSRTGFVTVVNAKVRLRLTASSSRLLLRVGVRLLRTR